MWHVHRNFDHCHVADIYPSLPIQTHCTYYTHMIKIAKVHLVYSTSFLSPSNYGEMVTASSMKLPQEQERKSAVYPTPIQSSLPNPASRHHLLLSPLRILIFSRVSKPNKPHGGIQTTSKHRRRRRKESRGRAYEPQISNTLRQFVA